MKRYAAYAGAVLGSALCLYLQWSLQPRWQEAAVQALTMGLLLTALTAFIRLDAWAAFTGVAVPLALYTCYLLVTPPLPSSLVTMYTTLTVIAVVVYVSVYERRLQDLVAGFKRLVTDPAADRHLRVALALIPLWAGAATMAKSFPERSPAIELRIVHPEPPNEIKVKGKSFDMAAGTNPLRLLKTTDPAGFAQKVAEGKAVYYKNCFFCHGDNLDGAGHFAYAFNPKPANFQDIGTIAMLQESYVFWRVSKGGPGLPDSSHPWSSAMPVWEDMLSEEDIWKAILFIYEGTGREPRTFAHEKAEHAGGAGAGHSQGKGAHP